MRRGITELEGANTARDADRSSRAARDLRYKLDRARDVATEGEDRSSVDELEREAKPHLSAAFQPSPAALAMSGGDTSIYKREKAAWCGDAGPAGADPAAVAMRGVSGRGGSLPHLGQIQKGFGSHDVTGIRAHVGGEAAVASQQLGARAFAVGNDVAFAGTPDLHTAAHEAAHVVQQRAGVALAGGIDRPGDKYEQNADLVADAVVRGESAAPLLDGVAGRGGGSSDGKPVVQRKTGDDVLPHSAFNAKQTNQLALAERAGAPITAGGYAHHHLREIVRETRTFLAGRTIPTGDPQVTLKDDFFELLFKAFDEDSAANVTRLRNWVAPDDLYALIDRNRPIFETKDAQVNAPNATLDYDHGSKGPAHWSPAVGVAIGSTIEARLRESLARMSPRLVAATARARAAAKTSSRPAEPVAAKDLVTSHPLDWQVALAMVGRERPGVDVKEGTLAARDDINTTYRKVRQIEWRQGTLMAKAIDPADATIEEMATHVLGKPTEAYRVQRVGNYFLFPESADVTGGTAQLETKVDRAAYGPDAALVENAEVERAIKNDVEVKAVDGAAFGTLQEAWKRIDEQLVGLSLVARPYGLDAQLTGARTRHDAHRLDLAMLKGRDAIVRAELFARQEQLLTKILVDIGAIASDAQQHTAKLKAAKNPAALTASTDATRNAMVKLVRAAGLAQLPETGEAAYAEAHAARRDLVLTTFEGLIGDIATQLEIARLTASHSSGRSARSTQIFKTSLQQRADALRQRLAALRSKMAEGTVDTQEIEALYAAIDSLRFEAGVVAGVGQLGDGFETLDKLEEQRWVLFSEGITDTRSVVDHVNEQDNRIGRLEKSRRRAFELQGDLQRIHSQWLKVQAHAVDLAEQLERGGEKNAHDRALALVQPQLAIIKADLAKLGGEDGVKELLNQIYDQAKSAERRMMVVRIATLIGVAIAANAAGTLAEGVAGGLGMSGLGASVVGLTAETTVFTLLDARLSGEPIVHAFVSNFAGNFATFAALRVVNAKIAASVIGKTLAKAAAGERVAVLAKLTAKLGAITAPAVVAIGIQFAQAEYESLRLTGKTMSLDELKMAGVQGVAMMIGSAISHKLLNDGMQELKGLGVRGGAAIDRRNTVLKLSESVMQSGDPAMAMAALHDARAAFEAEQADVQALGEMTDEQLAAQGMSRPVVAAFGKRAQAKLAALDALDAGTMSAQLGLDTVVPGHVYAGDPGAVQRVTEHYQSRGYRIEREGRARRVVAADGQAFFIMEREPVGANASQRPAERSPASGDNGSAKAEGAKEAPVAAPPAPDSTNSRSSEQQTGKAAAPADTEQKSALAPGLGTKIAQQVPEARYEDGGTFKLKLGERELSVRVRRTTGSERIVREGDSVVLEIPTNLDAAALEAATVRMLGEVRQQNGTTPIRSVETVHADHPALTGVVAVPAEVMFGSGQRAGATAHLEAMSPADYAAFTGLVNGLSEPVARAFMYKAAAAGNGLTELRWLAGEIAGKDPGWLIDHLTLGDPRGTGGGMKQQWSMSCNACTALTLRGNYDPVFALHMRMRNSRVGAANDSDPLALNMNQADVEREMLESAYQGSNPQAPPGHQGGASPRDTPNVGRYADDLLNSQSGATRITFKSIPNPSGAQVVAILEASLPNDLQVPLVLGDRTNPQAHYVLAQLRRQTGPETEFSFHDPGSGESTWVRASDIANDSIPGAFPKVGTVEEPSAQPPRSSTTMRPPTQEGTGEPRSGRPTDTQGGAQKSVGSRMADAATKGASGAAEEALPKTPAAAEQSTPADARERVSPERVHELSERVGLPVTIDESGTLQSGVELHYERLPNGDIRPTVVKVGRSAIVADVLAHRDVIPRITRYNGVLGKLRRLWDRLAAFFGRGSKVPKSGAAWESYQELAKLDDLILLRQTAKFKDGVVDASILDGEIAHLEGYRRYHEAIVEAAVRGQTTPGTGHIDSPNWRDAVGDSRGMQEIEDPMGQKPHQQRLPQAKPVDPSKAPAEASSGFWEDEHARGNTRWYSDNEAVNRVTGYKPIEFENGYPVLDPYAQETVYLKEMKSGEEDYGPADRELARRHRKFKGDGSPNQAWSVAYRKRNGLTWHHHQDGARMQLVPMDLHDNIPHAGGSSKTKNGGGEGASE